MSVHKLFNNEFLGNQKNNTFGATMSARAGAQAAGKTTTPAADGANEVGLIGGALGQFNPVTFGATMGATALSGIFQARAAEKARQRELELERDKAVLSVEDKKNQLQQSLLSGLSDSLSSIIMSRANARAI